MVDSECSGVMFTVDPATGDTSRIVIEAAFGLGEVVVGGQVEVDTYVVAKDGPDDRRPPHRREDVPDRARSRRSRSARRSRSRSGGAPRARATSRSSIWPGSRSASSALRAAAGHRVGDRERHDLLRAVAADHHARRRRPRRRRDTDADRNDRPGAGERLGHCAGCRRRCGANPARPERGTPARKPARYSSHR